jgi:small-conductance mechanosensitive channel
MSNKLLLPNKYKLIGWFLLIPATILGVILSFTGFEAFPLKAKVFAIFNDEIFGESHLFSVIETNITNTIVGILFIAGALFVAFSKEKSEDEFIAKLRLSSLLWAVWVNYILLLLAVLFVYGTSFFTVMVYNMFTVLIIFIVRFNYILYKNTKTVSDEE